MHMHSAPSVARVAILDRTTNISRILLEIGAQHTFYMQSLCPNRLRHPQHGPGSTEYRSTMYKSPGGAGSSPERYHAACSTMQHGLARLASSSSKLNLLQASNQVSSS